MLACLEEQNDSSIGHIYEVLEEIRISAIFFTIKYYNLSFFFFLGRREVLGFASPPNKKEETHKTPTEPDLICLED